jgi:hypothetical protein
MALSSQPRLPLTALLLALLCPGCPACDKDVGLDTGPMTVDPDDTAPPVDTTPPEDTSPPVDTSPPEVDVNGIVNGTVRVDLYCVEADGDTLPVAWSDYASAFPF